MCVQELFIAALVREADRSRVSNGPKGEIDYSHLGKLSQQPVNTKLIFIFNLLQHPP